MGRKRKHPPCLQCGQKTAKYPAGTDRLFCCLRCALEYAAYAAKDKAYDFVDKQWRTMPDVLG